MCVVLVACGIAQSVFPRKKRTGNFQCGKCAHESSSSSLEQAHKRRRRRRGRSLPRRTVVNMAVVVSNAFCSPLRTSAAASQSPRRHSIAHRTADGFGRTVGLPRRQLSSALPSRDRLRRGRAGMSRAAEKVDDKPPQEDPDARYPNGPLPSLFETVRPEILNSVFMYFIYNFLIQTL